MQQDDKNNARWRRWWQYARDEWGLARNDPVVSWLANPLGSLVTRTRWGRGLLWVMPIIMARLLVLMVPWLPSAYAASHGAPLWLRIATEGVGVAASIALLVLWWRQARAWWQRRDSWRA